VSYSSLLVSIIARVVIHNIYCSPSICTGFLQAAAQPPAWETKALIARNDMWLGWSMDVSGDTLIAGSWNGGFRHNLGWDPIYQLPGSAAVFVRTSTDSNLDWEQQGEPLVVDDGEGGLYYGYRVAIDGNTALISASKIETQEARLFVFERSGGVWEQKKILHTGGHDDGNSPNCTRWRYR
jgi:hypothetical protein